MFVTKTQHDQMITSREHSPLKMGLTPQFIDMLKEGGYEYNTAIDFTPQLLAGLARRSVEHWSRSTGFPVPAGTPIEDDDQRPPRRIS